MLRVASLLFIGPCGTGPLPGNLCLRNLIQGTKGPGVELNIVKQ